MVQTGVASDPWHFQEQKIAARIAELETEDTVQEKRRSLEEQKLRLQKDRTFDTGN